MNRLDPSELVRFQPPVERLLDEIIVRVKPRSRIVRPEEVVPTQATVGSPMGAKQYRRRISRALRRETEVSELIHRIRDERASVIQHAREEFAARTGLAETFLRDDLPLDPETIFSELNRRVIGQDAACRLMADGEHTPRYEKAVLNFFRPEFVNRLDGLATFDPLSAESIEQITQKELAELESR